MATYMVTVINGRTRTTFIEPGGRTEANRLAQCCPRLEPNPNAMAEMTSSERRRYLRMFGIEI